MESEPRSQAEAKPESQGHQRAKPPTILDDFELLSAIWMLASNDENPIITYGGLSYRLETPDKRVRELVRSRPDLFRRKVASSDFQEFKTGLEKDPTKTAWLLAMDEETRKKVLAALSMDDAFRSQFRGHSDPAKPEIIELGLTHLQRLREFRAQQQEEK